MAVGAVSAGYYRAGYPAKTKQDKAGMDFSFAANAPDVVQEAVRQAAGETGYRIGGKMTHISQIVLQQLQNLYNGVSNPQDVFGGSVASARRAAESMLWNLEHPRACGEAQSSEVMRYREQEKNFYRVLVEKLSAQEETQGKTPGNRSAAAAAEKTGNGQDAAQERMDYQKFLHKKIEELYVKFQNGESEPSYQIGAASFTEKEWDNLLEKFDKLEDEIRTQMREEYEKRAKEQEASKLFAKAAKNKTSVRAAENETSAKAAGKAGLGTSPDTKFPETESNLLSGTYTSASYPSSDLKSPPDYYITCYTEDGISCRGKGKEWFIPLKNAEEYNKVMAFINQFPSDWNLRFAANENFWKDFLDDAVDLPGFMQFMEGTDHGVPDYTITVGDSTYIDREKAQWAKYMNQGNATFYTAQEMWQMQEEQMKKNQEGLSKLTDPYGKIYRRTHPEYHGERMFCEYPGGPLYTADEIGRRMYENYLASEFPTIRVF